MRASKGDISFKKPPDQSSHVGFTSSSRLRESIEVLATRAEPVLANWEGLLPDAHEAYGIPCDGPWHRTMIRILGEP